MNISPLKTFPFVFNLSTLLISLYHSKTPFLKLFLLLTNAITLYFHLKIVNFHPIAQNGSKYCEKCRHDVPSGAKHSSRTNYCIDRYDHFCVLFQVPIGKLNKKLYILMQILEIFYCLIVLRVLFGAIFIDRETGPGEILHVVLTGIVFLGVLGTLLLVVKYQFLGVTQYEQSKGRKVE